MKRDGWVRWGAVAAAVALVVLALWKWSDWRAGAQASSAYAARLTCSCRYVDGRSGESCAQDIAADTGLVRVTEKPEEKRIIARVPLLGHAEARFKQGYGCLMVPR